jgi:hypothetical protein
MRSFWFALIALGLAPCVTFVACADTLPRTTPSTTEAFVPGFVNAPARSFEDDLAFLRAHGPVYVLEAPSGGRVVVSTRWQARVMTSAVEPDGMSLGFLHRAFIESGKTGTPFDNYGGEDRFWLGPEGGQYGLYFSPGAPFVMGSWQTPHELQEGEWELKASEATHMTLSRVMHVVNWSRATFDVAVERTVRVLSASEVGARFGEQPPPGVKWVSFETVNRITNIGQHAWTPESGLISVWILGMYNPAPDARVIVPFDSRANGSIVNDEYFGKVPHERLAVHEREGWLAFVADGTYRSKIGLGAARARDELGSYSPSLRLLTLVSYSKPASAKGYVNSMWTQQREPFGGDVVNSYNDGPTEPGKPSLGGFYELETSSPAAALAPGETLEHVHTTLHAVGSPASLDPLARRVLGVPIAAMAQ